jgi:hypothetical protein
MPHAMRELFQARDARQLIGSVNLCYGSRSNVRLTEKASGNQPSRSTSFGVRSVPFVISVS